jgi:hypothetical protein
MNCKDIDKLLTAYLEGVATPQEQEQVQAHLAGCSRCRQELEALTVARNRLSQALKLAASRVTPPPGSWQEIAEQSGIKDRVEKPAPKKSGMTWLAVPVSVFLLVILLGGVFSMFGGAALPPPEPPAVVADGSGGAFLFWLDEPSEYGDGIYAQHVDAAGNRLWGEKGKLLAGEADVSFGVPLAISDGAGGAIVAWAYGDGSFVQRLDSAGNNIWDGGKVLVWAKPTGGWHSLIGMTTDGSGGAILLMEDSSDIVYAQRVSADGSLLWGEGGSYIGQIQLAYQGMPMVADGAGGAVLLWKDSSVRWIELYAQRISQDGKRLWGTGGVLVSTLDSEKDRPQLINDGTRGFIIAWADTTNETFEHGIYAQKLDAEGQPIWGDTGVPICEKYDIPRDPQITADGSGGCVIAWRYVHLTDVGGIFAQRLSPDGERLWQEGGVPLWDIPQGLPDSDIGDIYITGDGSGDSIVIWKGSGDATGVFAQKLDAYGHCLWSESGLEVYQNPSFRTVGYSSVISDGSGGFIIGSRVSRGSDMSRTDSVYTQRIDSAGNRLWGENGLEIQLKRSSPILPIIAAVVVLVTVLILFGVFRHSRTAAIFTAIAPVLIGITALVSEVLLIFSLGYSYPWAYVLDTPLDLLSVAVIPVAGLAIAVVGIWKRTVTRWLMVPVLAFSVLIAVIVELMVYALVFL